jgi:hypothetical protein
MDIRITRIVIAQSLSAEEFATGRRLRDEIEPILASLGLPLTVELVDVNGAPDFEALLARLTSSVAEFGTPLLHIECHGSNDKQGLVFADGSHLTWRAIKPPLTALNIATRLNLVVVLGCCYGAFLGSILEIDDRAPVCAYIGPTDAATAGDLAESYAELYRELLTTGNGTRAIEKLMTREGHRAVYFSMLAEELFSEAYKRLFARQISREEMWAWGSDLREKLKASMGSKTPSIQGCIDLLRKQEPETVSRVARHYFMVDLYPENEGKFPITRERLLA